MNNFPTSMSYTQDVNQALAIAQSIAKENRHGQVSAAHLLQALLHNEIGLASYLAAQGKDIHYLRDWAEVRLEEYPKAIKLPDTMVMDSQLQAVMQLADVIRLQFSQPYVDPLCVLAALVKPGIAFSAEQLKSLPLSQKEILSSQQAEGLSDRTPTKEKAASPATPANTALEKYCLNKTTLAANGKVDPIIGRDREIRMMAQILGRRTKPNIILVGEPGVGKTALIDGFALEIVRKQVPEFLQSALIFELDTGALIAGASYKGEIEDRIKSIIKEIKAFPKAILFIDEIHSLLDSKGSIGTGVANLLKPELARGELTVIGATTNDEYRQFLEPDEGFSRRFEILRVEEPSIDVTIRMVKHLLPFYEKHHGIAVAPEAVGEGVRLAKRYMKDRRLPDSAIDLMDRTMAAIRIMQENSARELEALTEQLNALTDTSHALSEDEYRQELYWFHTQLHQRISPILFNQLENQTVVAETGPVTQLKKQLDTLLADLLALTGAKKSRVEKQDIAAMVSYKTGIPLGKLQSRERDKLLNMESMLRQRVIGQDHAVKILAEAILESRSGLIKAGQPIGSFFLLGPTGTGKTELAKALADYLFNDEAFLIRFDMSEFKEEHSAALLYGAPPGYVGYQEGGLLVNKIREKPYSVVLFDEIEKAHPSVYDIFLQILDEGRLHDRLGKEGDFSNAVILFTSNIGSEFVTRHFTQGVIPSGNELMEIMGRHFRPEFLARLTEIVPFAPIWEENVVKIFDIQLKGLTDLLHKQGITLEISEEARKHLALAGFSSAFGARPLKAVIRNQLRRPISKMIISGELTKGMEVSITLNTQGAISWQSQVPVEA